MVIGVVFPGLLLIRRHEWSKQAQLAAATMAAVAGLFWFVDRLATGTGLVT